MPEPFVRNPNFECKICGKPIYKRPSAIKLGRVYCSKKCHGLSQRIEHPCPVCGVAVLSSRNALTCSRACSNKNRTGVKYKIGRPRDVAFRLRTRKAELLEERGGKCERCGFSNVRALEVHHVERRCDGGTDDKSNLLILCANCHVIQHRNTEAEPDGRAGTDLKSDCT